MSQYARGQEGDRQLPYFCMISWLTALEKSFMESSWRLLVINKTYNLTNSEDIYLSYIYNTLHSKS